MILYNSDEKLLATLTPDVVIPEKSEDSTPNRIKGETTIYGRLSSLGGIRRYTAKVNTELGEVSCRLSEENARLARNRLFTVVGLRGVATWELPGFRLLELEVEEILDYEEKPADEAIREMSRQFGHFFDDIDDVNEWIKQMRSDGESVTNNAS